MAIHQVLQGYLRNPPSRVGASDSRELTPLLLLAVLKKITQARAAHRAGDRSLAGFYLGRATCVVDQLRDQLDLENGGRIAHGYEQFYCLIDECLQKALLGETEPLIDLAEEYLNKATDWWVFSGTGFKGQIGHA